MAISHKHKLIFVHNPKCAGTSIINYFDLEDWGHQHAVKLKEKYSEYWDEYKKFVVIRNPWDRFYSNYRYIKMEENYYHYNYSITAFNNPELHPRNPNYKEGEALFFQQKRPLRAHFVFKDKTFKEYVDYFYYNMGQTLDDFVITKYQKFFIHPEVKTIRFENLEQELSNWLQKEIKLPTINSSPLNNPSPYTPELVDKVEKIYLPDIKILGYDRP